MQTDTSVVNLNTSLIVPNKYQPRKVFDDKALNNLAISIKNYGIINPILVRKKDDKYEIIAGERRFRAAQKIGLTEVPVIIKNADEQQMAELALIENIQRQDLSSIEIAKSYEEILRIGNQTQQSLAEKLGKSQSSVANKIRLLSLPQEIQDALEKKQISERHARSLLTVQDKDKQLELLNRIITEKLTVKDTEQIINADEITEDEIKQAISDIMKSLNIKEEEKEDDNMNNGNFFPNFDNNNAANNNASLNMMNMQSMNQAPVAPEPEVVMPTMTSPIQEQPVAPTTPMFDQFTAPTSPVVDMNNNLNPMEGFISPQENIAPLQNAMAPTMEPQMVNDTPLFGQQFNQPTAPVDTQPQMVASETPTMAPPMIDEPLFNPNLGAPVQDLSMSSINPYEQNVMVQEQVMAPPAPFEVPVSNEPVMDMPMTVDRLTQLQELLNANGYAYKTFSNDTDNCVIIELPRN